MKHLAFTVLMVAMYASACSGDSPQSATTTGTAGSAGAAGSGGMAQGAGGGAGSSGEGGNPIVEDIALTLVSPPLGMAFQRRIVDVEVAFSVPNGGATVQLLRGDILVDEKTIDAKVTTGTLRLKLPLIRGTTPFVVTLVLPSGQATKLEGHFHAGSLAAASIDTMYAIREGKIVQWGGGNPKPTTSTAPPEVISVAQGASTLYALDAQGNVFKASSGQTSFEIVTGVDNVTAVAPGSGHTLFLRADGRVFANGVNARGQLGIGDTESHADIVEVPLTTEIVAIAVADETSFAVDAHGFVHAWGSNDEGQLGIGDEDTAPHPVPLIVPNLVDIVDVAAGRDHVLVLNTGGGLHAWGLGSSGQIGDGSSGILASKTQPVPLVLPANAIAVAARGNTSYAILSNGELLGWGQNSQAQLGVGDTNQRTKPSPCLVGSVRALGAGLVGAVAVNNTGIFMAWGSNASGQLAMPLPPEGPARLSVPTEVSPP